ncbi:MAG: Rieske 2Fe-2S domain-containing protein [Stellaceae bacterium]
MLDIAKNKLITEVGPGTKMGELLRRYWMPIAGASEFDDETRIKPVRLMGEDLVLYKDFNGTYGLIDRHCCHRRADLSYGFVEDCGLRCNYHGWLYDEKGRCLAQPYEDTAHPGAKMKDRIRIKAYKVAERAGLLWAYLGPEPAPLVPNWEPFTWKNGFVQIVLADVPCNWLQAQENSIDPVHFEWMHLNWNMRLHNQLGPYSPRHVKVDFDEFDYGFTYKRIKEDTSEQDLLWTVGRVCLWPNALFTGDHFEWRVPVDDDNMLSVTWCFNRVPKEREPYVQNRVPTWKGPIKDPATGRWISSHVMNQDFIAWVGQGTIADRENENLAASDKGVALLRRRFFEDMDRVAQGQDPKGLVRDEKLNEGGVPLPIAFRKQLVEGMPRQQMIDSPQLSQQLRDYVFQTGQPAEVRRAFVEAMGVDLPPAGPVTVNYLAPERRN